MKIRYFKSIETMIQRSSQRKTVRLNERQHRIAKWHKKFAWRPLTIETPNDAKDHSTVVWFEYVMQKGFIKDIEWAALRRTIWTRHTEKEYFRKKLDGTLEPEQSFATGTEDMQNTSFGGASIGSASLKKGGPYTSPNKMGGPSAGVSGPPAGPSK